MRQWLGSGLAALALTFGTSPATAAPSPPQKPKLIVVIAVDQFSGNLFDEWRGRFDGGLKRLSSGIAYPAGYQSHGATETCPGHSTILTGKHPTKTGIVGNDVRDPQTREPVYCLYDSSVTLAHDPKARPVGPRQLMASTLGEWLKAASPQSRVVAVSGKDRASINLAGHSPDGVFWLPENGEGFTTYVRPGEDPKRALEPVAEVNARIHAMMTTTPDWTITHADCRAREAEWALPGRTWRSTLPPEEWKGPAGDAQVRRRVRGSSTYDNATLEGARALIRRYGLGKGPATDLLAVGFSSTDFVGHRYGSRGPEMCEQMHNLDRLVGELLADLDGLGVPYMVALTADHGGLDLPERLAAQGYPAYRIDMAKVLARVNGLLRQELGLAYDPLKGSLDDIILAPEVPAQRRAAVTLAATRVLKAQPEVADAFGFDEVVATPSPGRKPVDELSVRERFAESAYRGRSPDIMVALQPYTTTYAGDPGENVVGHSSGWNYDRRVPILFWWPGAPSENRFLPIETVDIAPTLASVLGVAPPMDVDGRALPLPGLTRAASPR